MKFEIKNIMSLTLATQKNEVPRYISEIERYMVVKKKKDKTAERSRVAAGSDALSVHYNHSATAALASCSYCLGPYSGT